MSSGYYWIMLREQCDSEALQVAYCNGEEWSVVGWDGAYKNDEVIVVSERLNAPRLSIPTKCYCCDGELERIDTSYQYTLFCNNKDCKCPLNESVRKS